MILPLIPSLLASFKTGLSEFGAIKFRSFLGKEERNSKVSPHNPNIEPIFRKNSAWKTRKNSLTLQAKEKRNSKESPHKVKKNSVHTFDQFLQFSLLPFIAVVHV